MQFYVKEIRDIMKLKIPYETGIKHKNLNDIFKIIHVNIYIYSTYLHYI